PDWVRETPDRVQVASDRVRHASGWDRPHPCRIGSDAARGRGCYGWLGVGYTRTHPGVTRFRVHCSPIQSHRTHVGSDLAQNRLRSTGVRVRCTRTLFSLPRIRPDAYVDHVRYTWTPGSSILTQADFPPIQGNPTPIPSGCNL